VHSRLFYLDCYFPAGARLRLPSEGGEGAVYVARGAVRAGGERLAAYTLGVAENGSDLEIVAETDARLMLLGGEPLGKRWIEWNFVSSQADAIAEAKEEWKLGPGTTRFPKIPGDDQEFIPLPPDPAEKPGTIM
jgi:redox-sensitive bicupin YhaK (pirin superfamily)